MNSVKENTLVHNHYTKDSDDLHKKINRKNLGIYMTRNKEINIWKAIPNKMIQSISRKVFKKDQRVFTIE